MKLRITQDREANASYIYLQEGATFARTIDPPNGVNVDIDVNGNIIGIEILELLEVVVLDITRSEEEQANAPRPQASAA